MTDLSKCSCLIVDRGLFLSFALKMRDPGGFGRVIYANETRSQRPSFQEMSVGKGYEGIEVVKNPWDVIDDVDCIAFPDVLDGDLQAYLRRHGYPVWGSAKGEELELYRYYSKRMIAAVGLPMNKYVLLKGVTALRDYLKEHKDQFVKVSYLRGLWESRHHEEYWISKTHIDRLEYQLGPLAEDTEFIVEAPIKTKLEIGYDGIFVTEKSGVGRFLKYGMNGVEKKDECYFGVVQEYADMAEEFRDVNEALAPVLQEYQYCNMFSTELRVQRDPFLIDPCCRQGSPSGEAQLAVWTNMPQIVYAGARGEAVDQEVDDPYVAQVMIYNKGDENEWCAVKVPKEVRPYTRLYFGMRKGDEDWVVPQMNGFDEVGSIIATGSTAKEAKERCAALAEEIGGDVTLKTESLDKALEEFEIMESKGINVESV